MTREEAINHIENLFPVDSEYESTSKTGQRLLDQAKRDAANWRHEPTEVLVRYAELCIDLDNRPF